MKIQKLTLAIAALFFLTACGSTRIAGSGVNISEISEFAFLKPCAYMVLYDTDGGYFNQQNSDIAANLITTIINSERFPFTDVMEADYSGKDKDALEWAKTLVEADAKKVSRLRVPKSLLERLNSVDNRYGIFIYSRGYTTTEEAYNKERAAKAASKVIDSAAEKLIGITGLTNPSRNYTPDDPYGNEMLCVVIDKQEKNVIYYAKQTPTFSSFPKDQKDVSDLLHNLLKDFIR